MRPPAAMRLRDHVRWLASLWRPHWRFVLLLLGFTAVSSSVAIAYPLVFRWVLDGVYQALEAGQMPPPQLPRLLGILGLIALGRLVAGFYPGFRAWMNQIVEKTVRDRVFRSILEKDHTFLGRFRTGDLVTRLTDDIAEYPRIAWFACSGIFRFLDSISRFLLCVGAMLLLETRLALLAMIPVPVMLYVFYLARRELSSTYQRQQEAVSRTNDSIEAALSGIRIVKAFNAQEGQERRLEGILEERVGIQLKLARLQVLVHELDGIAARIGQVIVLSVGGLAVLDGRMSMGTLYALYVYLDLLIRPMMDLPNLFVTARQAFVSIQREEEILRFPVTVQRTLDGPDPGPLADLELEGVRFSYRPDLPPALESVSFRAQRGQTLAVVGPVAGGKSTLLRVLAGLVPPERGAYLVNGRPAGQWDWPALRARIGYVPQESLLFSETIEENVSFGREANRERVQRCLQVAQMGEDLAQMAEGCDTRLGQRGTLVSGGQKQRIAIARALAGQPDLLLLDDCTASLDSHHEERFWRDLAEAFPSAIKILVSHRPATIRRADRILVLEQGRLVDAGTHAELASRCAVYQDLLRTEERINHLQRTLASSGPGDITPA